MIHDNILFQTSLSVHLDCSFSANIWSSEEVMYIVKMSKKEWKMETKQTLHLNITQRMITSDVAVFHDK